MVDSSDWTESSELEEVTYWWSNGPNAEVRVILFQLDGVQQEINL